MFVKSLGEFETLAWILIRCLLLINVACVRNKLINRKVWACTSAVSPSCLVISLRTETFCTNVPLCQRFLPLFSSLAWFTWPRTEKPLLFSVTRPRRSRKPAAVWRKTLHDVDFQTSSFGGSFVLFALEPGLSRFEDVPSNTVLFFKKCHVCVSCFVWQKLIITPF